MGKVSEKENLTVPSSDSRKVTFAVGTFPTNGRRDCYSIGQNKVFQAMSEIRT